MAHSVVLGGERQAGPFRNWQRIEVGPQSYAVCRVGGSDVRDQSAAGKGPNANARGAQPGRDDGRRADLFARQLGVGVEVTAEGDELVLQGRHRLVQDLEIRCGRWKIVLRVHER